MADKQIQEVIAAMMSVSFIAETSVLVTESANVLLTESGNVLDDSQDMIDSSDEETVEG